MTTNFRKICNLTFEDLPEPEVLESDNYGGTTGGGSHSGMVNNTQNSYNPPEDARTDLQIFLDMLKEEGPSRNFVDLIEYHHFDYSDLAETNVTIPSRIIHKTNIPEMKSAAAEFVYNYYTPDERVRNDENPLKLIDGATDINDAIYIAKKEQTPRFVKLVNTKNLEVGSDYISSFEDENIDPSEFLTKVTIEGSLSNRYFTGVELVDTNADQKIYSLLTDSLTFMTPNTDLSSFSQKDLTDYFYEQTREKNTPPRKNEKLLFQKTLANLQAGGVAMATSDITQESIALTKDPISQQSFSCQFNNLFFKDIIDVASNTPNNVFEDEIRALKPHAADIQSNLLNTIDPTMVYDHDYNQIVQPYTVENDKYTWSTNSTFVTIVSDNGSSPRTAYNIWALNTLRQIAERSPESKLIGYVIQKYEVTTSGSTIFRKNFIITSANNFTEFIDDEVAYGAAYVYKVRTIAVVSEATFAYDEIENSLNVCTAKNVILSEGKTISVACVETKIPPPPQGLKVKINYKHRKPYLRWNFPFNKQRDIKKFQIFKRQSIDRPGEVISALDQPFTLIAELDFDNSVIRTNYLDNVQRDRYVRLQNATTTFLDTDFNMDEDEAVYALCSVDAHGMTSNYSSQILAKYDRVSNRMITKVVSSEGAPKPYPNLYLNQDFFEDCIKQSNKTRALIFFDPEYYKVYEEVYESESHAIRQFGNTSPHPINYINASLDDSHPYVFHFINVDNQKDATFEVRVVDKSGPPGEIPAANLSINNLNFEFGV